MTISILITIGVAFLASLALTRIMIAVAPKLGLVDRPDERRIHDRVIPRAGGIAVWVSFLAAGALALSMFAGEGAADWRWFRAFVLASGILLAVGVWDDRFGMSPWLKLGFQAGVAVLLFFAKGSGIGSFMGWQVPWWLDLAIWVAWTVGIINAFNLIDGMDGLCAGLASISLTALAIISMVHARFVDSLMMWAMLGALLGFLRYNFHPARIFLGDAGSMFIGLFIASAATNSVGQRAVTVSVLIPLLVAGVPLFDVLLAVWRRTARRWLSGLGVGHAARLFGADKDHLHHRLLQAGLTQRKVAGILYAIALLGAVVAVLPSIVDERAIGITVAALLIAGLLGFRYVAPVEVTTSGAILHLALKRPAAGRLISLIYFFIDGAAILLALGVAIAVETNGLAEGMPGGNLLVLVAVTLACGLLGLRMAKAHSRHWARASIRDFWALVLWYIVAMQVAFTIMTLIDRDLAWSSARIFFMTGTVSLMLITISRSLTPLIRESAIDSHHRRRGGATGGRDRLVLYGAGDLGELFLSHLKTTHNTHMKEMRILGFLDDHPHLKGRVLDGFRIFGALDDLPRLAKRFGLRGVILTVTRLDSERADLLNRLVEEHGLILYRWRPQLSLARIESHQVLDEHVSGL